MIPGTRTRDRRFPEDLRADSMATAPPTPPDALSDSRSLVWPGRWRRGSSEGSSQIPKRIRYPLCHQNLHYAVERTQSLPHGGGASNCANNFSDLKDDVDDHDAHDDDDDEDDNDVHRIDDDYDVKMMTMMLMMTISGKYEHP
ncbi:hypothetical protein PoB_000563700 [Plakobranchus ocellatus]|uniref:Uncharacterized protein n=1 Tax=Plakobranchus ocellatus TaxID=259542 RepID=A0AAV3YAJ0_9GAST|nr:hypothetical protein PoB_000563700 [Plakobranchus ocellatus]